MYTDILYYSACVLCHYMTGPPQSDMALSRLESIINASLMLKAGVPMKVASERLGHTTIGITMDLYSHIDEDMQKDAADKIDKIINL